MPTKKKIIPKKDEIIAVKEKEEIKIPNFSYKQIEKIPIKIEFNSEVKQKINKLFDFKTKPKKALSIKFSIPKFTLFKKLWNKYVNLWNLYINKEKGDGKNG